MKNQWKKSLWIVCILSMVLPMTSSAENRIGGMTLSQAFPDAHVVKLIEAVTRGNYAEADKQIKAGADVNYIGTEGISPLLWTIFVWHEETHELKGVEYLLKACADPNYRDAKDHNSAMYFAAGTDTPTLLELLLKYKGDPNLLGPFNEPLLHVAVGQRRKENIELLLKYGANINVRRDGSTAAQESARLGRFDLVALFLEKGLDYDLQGLGVSVEASLVAPSSEQQHWKDKVIVMLKERGVKFPAFIPNPPLKLDLPDKF
jgi:uncharacterized protein